MDGQFRLVVSVTDVGKISTVLQEAAFGEEYILHRMPGANGAFAGRVKEEYELISQTISEQCFEPDNPASVVDGVRFFPGYHMNKRHWYTICLDGSVPIEKMYQRINASCLLAVGRTRCTQWMKL